MNQVAERLNGSVLDHLEEKKKLALEHAHIVAAQTLFTQNEALRIRLEEAQGIIKELRQKLGLEPENAEDPALD